MLVHAGSPRALRVSGLIACRWSIDSAGRLACHWEAEGPDDPKPSRRSQSSEGIHEAGGGRKSGVGDHTPERVADHEGLGQIRRKAAIASSWAWDLACRCHW
jgi:hypothetical protein